MERLRSPGVFDPGISETGTDPESASMAGLKVVVVKCDERGNIDIEDLKTKAEQHRPLV